MTGWFFDQRDNRRFVASLAAGARVISGGRRSFRPRAPRMRCRLTHLPHTLQ
jgi:hypothetical protein